MKGALSGRVGMADGRQTSIFQKSERLGACGWLDCVPMNAHRLLPTLFVLALLGLLCVVVARASDGVSGDLIAERGFVRDAQATLTIETIEAARFTPFSGPLALGNTGITTWLRLVVPALPDDRRRLMLVLQPATTESATVFVPTTDGWSVTETGSRIAFAKRATQGLNPSVPFQARPHSETVLYVRVKTPTATVHAQVLTPEAAAAFDNSLHVGMGLYLGFALVMTLLSASLWISTRNALWGLAALFDLATIAHSSMPLGLMAKFVLPQAGNVLPTLWLVLTATHLLIAGLLWSRLIRMLEAPRWCEYGYLAALPVFVFSLVLILSGRGDAVLGLVNLGVLALTLWGALPMLLIRTSDPILRWVYRTLISGVIAYLLLYTLPIFGERPASLLNLYPTIPINLVSMVMVVVLLARRTMLDLRERTRLERVQLETVQRLALEQAHHAQTSGMLGMIMHEVKNPLATIQLASELLSTGRTRSDEEQARRFVSIQRAVENINTVLQRCLDVDHLDHGVLNPNLQPEELTALLQHWCDQHPQRARLHVALPEALDVEVDGSLLLLLLGNLVDNALKYSPPGSIVDLRLLADESSFWLDVRNAVGRAGWPDESKLFQKFYRSAQAKREPGSGLGLYWVRTVSAMLGGEVLFARDGDLVLFTLRMPR